MNEDKNKQLYPARAYRDLFTEMKQVLVGRVDYSMSYSDVVNGILLKPKQEDYLIDIIKDKLVYGSNGVASNIVAPVYFFLEENYDKILSLCESVAPFNSFYEDISYATSNVVRTVIQDYYNQGKLKQFLGSIYSDCERIYNLSKLYPPE